MSSSAPSPQRDPDVRDPAPGSPPALTVVSRDASTALPPVRADGHLPLTGPVAGILMGNAITFIGATFQHWPALPVMIVYWGQSVAIGVANVIRMRSLTDFSTDNFTSNGRPVPATPTSARSVANFFTLHYGMFHLVYALFLLRGGVAQLGGWTGVTVAVNVALFAASHIAHLFTPGGMSYRHKPNLGALMFYPYLRVLPMHFAIILGSVFPLGALPFFILLKTGADLGLHAVECRIFQSPED